MWCSSFRVWTTFGSHHDVQFYPLSWKRHEFVANCNQIKLHCAWIECFLYSLACGEHLGLLSSLAIVNSAPVNMDVQASLSGSDCRSLPRSSGSGSYGMLFLGLLLEPPLRLPQGCSLVNLTTQSDLRYLPVSNRSIIKHFFYRTGTID